MGERIRGRVMALACAGFVAAVIGCGGGGGGTGGTNATATNGATNTTGQAIFVADSQNNRIVSMTNLQGGAGWQTYSTGQFMPLVDPNGLSVDSQGRIYFTLFSQHRIARIDNLSGSGFVMLGGVGVNEVQQLTVSGTGTFRLQVGANPATPTTGDLAHDATAAQIEAALEGLGSVSPSGVTVAGAAGGPFLVTFDSGPLSGSNVPLILSTTTSGNVVVNTSNITAGASLAGSGVGQFTNPFATAVDLNGRIFVVDRGNNRIVRMDDITGTGWVTIGTLGSALGEFNSPNGIAISADGTRAYVADSGNSRIVELDVSSGAMTALGSFGTAGAGTNQFGAIGHVALDSQGRIYATDPANNRVIRIDDMTGANWTAYAPGGAQAFVLASGIAIDSNDRIYVSDEDNNRVIRMNDMTGAGWVSLGSAGTGAGQFNRPGAIYIR